MFSPTKTVAWKNWDEWRDVHSLLYSNDTASIMQGVAKVTAWSVKFPIPTAIEVTASLQKNLHEDRNVLGLSLSIIRFINGVVEPFKSIDPSNTISSISSQHGIPDYIVTIRHSATHGRLPTFEFAKLAALQALQWLEENYWEPQNQQLFLTESDFMKAYVDYLTKDIYPFEFMQKNMISSFGVDVLVHKIMLNSNQTRDTLSLAFKKKVADLIQVQGTTMKHFPAAISMKLTEEMCKGNGLASIWLEYLIERNLAPLKSIAMITKWAKPDQLAKSIPTIVLKKLPDISRSASCSNLSGPFQDQVKWPPTSIGNMPIEYNRPLTILPTDFEYAEDIEKDAPKESEIKPKEVIEISDEKEEEEDASVEEVAKKEDESDSDIEIW